MMKLSAKDPKRKTSEYREYQKLMTKKNLCGSESTRLQELKCFLGLDGQSDPRPWWQAKNSTKEG